MAEADIYRVPEANLEVAAIEKAPFYVVSPRKLLVLFFGTLGFYQLYWFWAHWNAHRLKEGTRIRPVLRAIFAIFFVHRLFRLFDEKAARRDRTYIVESRGVASIYVAATVLPEIVDLFSISEIGAAWTDVITVPTLVVIALCLHRAQWAANIASGDEAGLGNADFTAANLVWLTAGGVLWLVVAFLVYSLLIDPGLVE